MSFTPRKPYDDVFFAALEAGKSKERSAELAGVRDRTIRYRQARDPDFATRVETTRRRFFERSVSSRMRRLRAVLSDEDD